MTKISTLRYTYKCGTTINFACGGFQFGHCIRFYTCIWSECLCARASVCFTCLMRLSRYIYTMCVCVCVRVYSVPQRNVKKMCVDKWLMMDILMNCCLFCSINFIIHCRWWFFSSPLLLLFAHSQSYILSHRQKRMPFFWQQGKKPGGKGGFRWHETSTSNAFKFGCFFRAIRHHTILFSIYGTHINNMNHQICAVV